MDIHSWNKETRQAYVGTLLYSLLGILAAILSPIAVLSALSGGGAVSVLLVLTELAIICGYVIFFLAIKDLKNLTEGEDQNAFKKIFLSIIFDILAAIFGIFHLGIVAGIFGLISCILLIMAYSVLKKSPAMAALSANTASGFSTLFTAEILVIIGICIGWIPIVGTVIAAILKTIAWVMVLVGWSKVAKPVAAPGEAPEPEKPVMETVKQVFTESFEEAKVVAKDMAEKSKVVAEEVAAKAKEATENIKERLDETPAGPEAPAEPEDKPQA